MSRPWWRGLTLAALGILALALPFGSGRWAVGLLGGCLTIAGALGLVQAWLRGGGAAGGAAYATGLLMTLAGGLLLVHPALVVSGLLALMTLVLATDGLARLLAALRSEGGAARWWAAAGALVSGALALLLWSRRGSRGAAVTLGIVVGLYLLSHAWSILVAPAEASGDEPDRDRHPDPSLGLPPHPELARLAATAVERARTDAQRDLYWSLTIGLVFLAIHVGRMSVSLTWLGLLSPAVAVAGDVGVAALLAVGLIIPGRLLWRALTRPLERAAWRQRLGGPGPRTAVLDRLVDLWLDARLGWAARLRDARGSLRSATGLALAAGLPLTAVLVATNPIWGFSWYFNSENWASGVWQRIAETRVDAWREEMVRAVRAVHPATSDDPLALFDLHPEGIGPTGDWSFLVVGDPGEGDSSQASLRDRYLELGRRADVKFLVIASDVIYPSGEMKDYEFNFYLPFKGFEKPVYAIPGNHDWFNALNGFAANFLTPAAARAAIEARVVHDLGYGGDASTTAQGLVAAADRLRREYGVRSGGQRAPYFALRAGDFTLLAVDTGILRRVDPLQEAWLEAALARARGTLTMVILGHPLYAGGAYQGTEDAAFAALHERLRAHRVALVMAGDTHDFEYYRETYGSPSAPSVMHHVVNGGGGAYLSIGTALAWPARPPVADWAFYPPTEAVRQKLDAETPRWKAPIWWWVKRFEAWPASVEALSAIFDFNRAPFFQSFVEVRVERSRELVRLVVHGPRGPLRWRDLQTGGQVRSEGESPDGPVELVIRAPRAG